MKKNIFRALFIIILLIGLHIVLNLKVSIRRGVNYQWHTVKLPLYLKVLDFFDRHFNYQQLVKNIVKDADNDEEKIMRLFKWTYTNLKKLPEGLPIVDDHVWYIIVRGYGVADQFSDVFTTLCNYAGINSFYSWVYTQDKAKMISFSFVKIGKKWFILDPYHGVYFKDKEGQLVDIEILKYGKECTIEALNKKPEINYATFFPVLPTIRNDDELSKASIQSPFKRFIFELRRWLRLK